MIQNLLPPLEEIKLLVYEAIDIAAAKATFEIRSMATRDRRSIGQKVRWMSSKPYLNRKIMESCYATRKDVK